MELLAWHRPVAARLPSLELLRRFVRHGENSKAPLIKVSFPGFVDGLLKEAQIPELAHLVEVWSHSAQLVARVRLLGICEFALCLSDSWDGGPVQIIHVVDPTKGKIVVDTIDESDGPPLNVAELTHPSKQKLRERYERVVAAVQKRVFDRGRHHAAVQK